MDSLEENRHSKTTALASNPTGLQLNSAWKKTSTTPTPILPPPLAQKSDWPDLSPISSLPSSPPSSTHDEATFYDSMDEGEGAWTTLSGTDSESESSPAPPVVKTDDFPILPQKIICLFCRSRVPLNGKNKPSFIQASERRKMLTNLCTHMHLNPSRIPLQCSEDQFPFCNMCIKSLKEMWEKEMLIREAKKSLAKLVEDVERTVADAEIFIQPCSSSTSIAEQRGFTELREMILDAYRDKLMMKKVVRESEENPGNPVFGLIQNSPKGNNKTTSIPAETGNSIEKATTKQNAGMNLVSVKMENANFEDEDDEDRNDDDTPGVMPIIKREIQLPPSKIARTVESYMPPPRLAKGPKKTQSYEGVQFFETRGPGNVELIQCSKCSFNVNSIKYRAEGKLPITSMKQHILRVHKNIQILTSLTRVRKNTSPVRKCIGIDSRENSKTKRGLRDRRKLKPSRIFSKNNVRTEGYVNVAKKPIAKKKQRKRRHRGVSSPLECALCDRIFQRKCEVANHFKSHKNQRPIAFKKEVIENPELPTPTPQKHMPSLIIPLSSSHSAPTASSSNADVEVRRELGAVRIIRNKGVRMTMTDLNNSAHSLEELCQAVGITP